MFRPKSLFLRVLLAVICIASGLLSLYVTLYALLVTVNSWKSAAFPEKAGRSIGVLLGVLLLAGVIVFFFRAAYRLLKTPKKKEEGSGKTIFRILWGVGCFIISAICALVVVLNIVFIERGRISVDIRITGNVVMILLFFTIASAFFLWRGIRWMKPPKKDKGAIELLGEEF